MRLLRFTGLTDPMLDQAQLSREQVAAHMLPPDSEPFDALAYRRVTGDLILDVAVPVFVHGLYIGAVVGGGLAVEVVKG